MRAIVMSALMALAAVLGGAAVPAAAAARPATAASHPVQPSEVALAQNSFPRISCVTARDCLAVAGNSPENTGSTPTALAIARWNGSGWKRLRVALPKGTRSADLSGVSCRTAKSCLVVGDYYTSAATGAASHALTLAYNGTSLKPTPAVPLPKSTAQATLGGVSCATARHCVAVGTASGSTSAFGATGLASVIETWNGAKWALRTIRTAASTLVDLTGISCVTSAFCVLAGIAYSNTDARLYLRSWNGTRLTAMKLAAAKSSTGELLVTGVSCATRTNCAVSGISDASNDLVHAFTQVWKGTAWQPVTATWPKGTAESELLGLSCYGQHACDAVGAAGSDAAPHATSAAFNGRSWTVQRVSGPAQGKASAFSDVSCLSATRCVAVGATGPASGATMTRITGVWNGTSWRLEPGF